MAGQGSFLKKIITKGIIGIVVGGVLVGVAIVLHFPPIFQAMFFLYAMLGAAVFILLDAPSMSPISGAKAAIALIVFYAMLSGAYIGGATLLPQYDPDDEKGKIEKLLRAKRAASEQGKAEELLARAKALSEKADSIMARLKAVGGAEMAMTADAGAGSATPLAVTGDIVALGKEQYELQECYNCHKLYGQGGKKRGPELDNIGNLLTPAQMKEKIMDPKSWMAEGFEKEYKKGKMPDKYRELMEESEIDALVAFLSTLKNPSVKTPKPIKPQ